MVLMTAPAAPTPTTLVTEAYNLAGRVPTATEITRGIDYGLEKVKRDLMLIGKTWKLLSQTAYEITVAGVSLYAVAGDWGEFRTVGYMSGDHSGTLSAVASGQTMTLAAAEDIKQVDAEGKYLLITSSTGIRQCEQIDNYVFATKVATLRGTMATPPANTSGYLVVNNIAPLTRIPQVLYDQFAAVGAPGTPKYYTILENTIEGLVAVYPVPNSVAGLQYRYFVDLAQLDLSSALYTTVLTQWYAALLQGVFCWCLQDQDDTRIAAELTAYYAMVKILAQRELIGEPNMTALQAHQGQ